MNQFDRAVRDAMSAPPDGTALGNLRHVVSTFADSAADTVVVQATGNVYPFGSPGVRTRGEHGATFTGLTHGDLRELLRIIDGKEQQS